MRFTLYVLAAMFATQAIADEPNPTPAASLSASGQQDIAPALLSLEEAVNLALNNQPLLEAKQLLITEARENAVAAGELPDPRLSFGLMSVPLNTLKLTQEDMTQAVVGVSQMIPGGNKLRMEREGLQRQAEGVAAALAALRRNIIRDAGLAWLDVLYPDTALKLVEGVAREYDRQIEWARTAMAANQLSQEEAMAIRVMREYVTDRKTELARQEARARAKLLRWVGDAAYRPLPAAIPTALPHPTSAPFVAEKMGGRRTGARAETGSAGAQTAVGTVGWAALESHPEIEMLRRAEAVAQTDANLAREAYKPDWNVELSYGVRGGGRPDLASAVVSVDLPLFTDKRQDKRLAGKLAAVARVQSELADKRLQLAADVTAAQADWDAANERVGHFESKLIPLAERRAESALASYRAGKSAFSVVLEARRALLEARLSLLEQQVSRARSAIEIQFFAD